MCKKYELYINNTGHSYVQKGTSNCQVSRVLTILSELYPIKTTDTSFYESKSGVSEASSKWVGTAKNYSTGS